MTLESVVTRMGIPMERPFHDALSDTLYTADVCRKLDLRAGLAAYPTEEESLRASLCPAPGDYRDFRVFRGYVEQSTWRSDPKIITASGPAGRPALELCPLCPDPGRSRACPLGTDARPADRADAGPGRKGRR